MIRQGIFILRLRELIQMSIEHNSNSDTSLELDCDLDNEYSFDPNKVFGPGGAIGAGGLVSCDLCLAYCFVLKSLRLQTSFSLWL